MWKLVPTTSAIIAVVVAWHEPDEWTAVICNNVTLDVHEYVGRFRTLEQCRMEAETALAQAGWGSAGAYECALNCEPWGDPEHDLLKCADIVGQER